jgi:hypothetical protein
MAAGKKNKRWFRPIGCLPLTEAALDSGGPSAPCRASRANADRLYAGEWRAMVEAKFGGPPTIDFSSPVMIDNRLGTVTAP